MSSKIFDTIILGGGASGCFAAILAKSLKPSLSILLIEKGPRLLAKVLKTGGGRCNLTNATFDAKLLASHYPRGEKELVGPLSHFGPHELMEWFESKGVLLKVENEGRVFPQSDRADTITNCLIQEIKNLDITVKMETSITSITKEQGLFHLVSESEEFFCEKLLIATGSSPEGYLWAKGLGHNVISPIPSLFAFSLPASPYLTLTGLAIDPVQLKIKGFSHQQEGSLLFTHEGFSGPAILKLSSHAAFFLFEKNYLASLIVDWLPQESEEAIFQQFNEIKRSYPAALMANLNPFHLPRPFWKKWCEIKECFGKMADLSLKKLHHLAFALKNETLNIQGKTTNKEEFVQAGGVNLSEIDFRKMESKLVPNLFFTGEILNIDGETGGFNLQNAWTTAFIASSSLSSHIQQ